MSNAILVALISAGGGLVGGFFGGGLSAWLAHKRWRAEWKATQGAVEAEAATRIAKAAQEKVEADIMTRFYRGER